MVNREQQPVNSVQLRMLDGSPPDPELVLDIFRHHIEINEHPEVRRTLDITATDFAKENGLEYERQTQDSPFVERLRRLVGVIK